MKKSLFILLAFFFALGCKEKKFGAFTVSGQLKNVGQQKILLQELSIEDKQPLTIDSATLDKRGNFILRGVGKEERLYRVAIEGGVDFIIINDNNNDLEKFSDSRINQAQHLLDRAVLHSHWLGFH